MSASIRSVRTGAEVKGATYMFRRRRNSFELELVEMY